MTVIRWLFIGDNPFRLYGFWASLVWIVPMVFALAIYFPFFETAGLRRWHGMIPLTWVLRCVPPIWWIVFFGWFIPHILRHRP